MDNNIDLDNSRVNSPAIEKPSHTRENITSSELDPNIKKPNKTKALILIFVPIVFWLISFGLMFIDLDTTLPTQGTGQFEVVEIKQNPILPFFNIINLLFGPVLLAMLIYGIILLIRRPHPSSSSNNIEDISHKIPRYTVSLITFILGVILLAIAYFIVWRVEVAAGYSGSEGGIAAIPFIFSGGLLIIISIIMFITTLIRRVSFERKNSKNNV